MIEIDDPNVTHRITCAAPGIRNHNGTPKPVATLTHEGIWVFCRWSREMEFITSETCLSYWPNAGEKSEGKVITVELVNTIKKMADSAYRTGRAWPISERLGALEDALDEIITLCEQHTGKV